MNELFRKSIRIFSMYPILWIPFVIAERANVWIWWYRHKAQQEITKYFLSQIPLSPSPSQAVRDALKMHVTQVDTPVGFGLQFSIACLYIIAPLILATSQLF